MVRCIGVTKSQASQHHLLWAALTITALSGTHKKFDSAKLTKGVVVQSGLPLIQDKLPNAAVKNGGGDLKTMVKSVAMDGILGSGIRTLISPETNMSRNPAERQQFALMSDQITKRIYGANNGMRGKRVNNRALSELVSMRKKKKA